MQAAIVFGQNFEIREGADDQMPNLGRCELASHSDVDLAPLPGCQLGQRQVPADQRLPRFIAGVGGQPLGPLESAKALLHAEQIFSTQGLQEFIEAQIIEHFRRLSITVSL